MSGVAGVAGVQELQELQEFRSSGVQEFRSSGVQLNVKNASNVKPPISLILIPESVSLRILQLLNSCNS
jgi:hypothetical protein